MTVGSSPPPRITVLTGAGISTDSGIPDFRGPKGVWTKNPDAEKLFTIFNYLDDPEIRRRSWLARRENPSWGAEPNAGHLALVELERRGALRALITQNIDRLHLTAGSSPELVLEIHGNMVDAMCTGCDYRTKTAEVLELVDAGDPDPRCPVCGSILKTATVMFGEQLDPDVLDASVAAASDCDQFWAIGSTLQVHPAAGLCDVALQAGAELVVINGSETAYDDVAHRVIHDSISTALPALLMEVGRQASRPDEQGG